MRRTMPLLRGGIYPADGQAVPAASMEGSMRSSGLVGCSSDFVARVSRLVPPVDEKARFFVDW